MSLCVRVRESLRKCVWAYKNKNISWCLKRIQIHCRIFESNGRWGVNMIFFDYLRDKSYIRCGLTWHKHTQETEKTSCFTSNGFHSTEITAHYSSLLLLRCKLETQKSLQTERKWRRVSAAVTCAMTQLCPTIWLRLEIHRSASIASSTTKMKESLESGAEGWKTHVNTHPWMNASTHVRESGWQKKERRCYRDVRVCLCASLHIIACWVRVD